MTNVDFEAAQPVPLSRIVKLAKPEVGILSVATVALLISSGMSLAYPRAVGWLVDGVLENSTTAELNQIGLLLLGLFVVQAVFAMLRSWLYTVAGERIVARLRTDLFRAIVGQDTAFFDAARTGELTNRLASDTTVLQNTVSVNVSMALRFGASAIGGIGLLLYMSPTLTGIAALVVPAVAIGLSVYGRMLRGLSSKVQDALADSTTVAEEVIQSVRTVRSFAQEDAETSRYGEAVQRSYVLAAKRALAIGVFNGFIGFAGYSAIGLVVWYGGSMVIRGDLSAGDLTSFVLYTIMVAMSLATLSNLYGDFMKAAGSSRRVFQLLDMVPELERTEGELLDHVDGHVTFVDVHFNYPTRPEATVFAGLNLELNPGEAVALVGPSGAGKSTVAALMTRLYDPSSGEVAIDGHPLRTLDPRGLRTHIATVAQEPVLFASSIRDNIRYGRPDATDAEVQAAAEAANAHQFVSGFPEGYDTLVGERGVRLSGGQKQRIAIARAVLLDPAILVLDEATSALDAESEHLVQEALDRLMKGRTTLVIAHRLSTVRGADRVAVIADGGVAEQGTHEALLEMNGIYRKLVERQFADAHTELAAS